MSSKAKFIVETTSTGYSAYRKEKEGIIVTTGINKAKLKANIVEAYNLHLKEHGKPLISDKAIQLSFA